MAVVLVGDDWPVTIADGHVARLGAVLGRLDDDMAPSEIGEELPACAGQAMELFEALQPITGIVIRLGAGPPPGGDVSEDASWSASAALARREVLNQEASAVGCGLACDILGLLDRIDGLIGDWPADRWNDAVGSRVSQLVDARERGARRGRELRDSRQDAGPVIGSAVGWLLRHPNDHWLRYAESRVPDAQCRALIQSLIARLQPTYGQLCGLELGTEEAAAQLIFEAEIADVSSVSWEEPVSAVVTAAIKGDAPPGHQIKVRLVEDPDAPFNGSLVSLLEGEQWHICASKFADGTLLPLDGTRRCAVAGP